MATIVLTFVIATIGATLKLRARRHRHKRIYKALRVGVYE